MSPQSPIETHGELLAAVRALRTNTCLQRNPSCLDVIGRFLTTLFAKLDRPDLAELGEREKKRLEELLKHPGAAPQEVDSLYRSAMEIPVLAPTNDAPSIASLSRLLTHSDKRIRRTACHSIGIVGGEKARLVLQDLLHGEDTDMKEAAEEALAFCDARSLADQLAMPVLQRIRVLESENTLRERLLSKSYSAHSLFIYSSAFLLAFLADLLAYTLFGVSILPPLLSFAGTFLTTGFVALSVWRYKCG